MGKYQKDIKYIPEPNLLAGVWMPFPDYEDSYQINEFGVVKSLNREIPFTNRWGQRIVRKTKSIILPWYISCKGYARVQLSQKHKGKLKKQSVHKIVVKCFVGNPNNLPQINHEDGNKLNNHFTNLIPCTGTYNQKHAYSTGLKINKKSWNDSQSKPVIKVSLSGVEIDRYGSMCEAEKITGISRTSISNSCYVGIGKRWSHNFKFQFLNKS